MMNRAMRTLFVLVMVFLCAVSVFSGNVPETTQINFALSGNPDTLDPHATTGTLTFQAIRSIYDTLVEPDENGVIVPALAESWVISADNLTWTFNLKKGVVFHDGSRFTSADVKATAERLVALDSGSASEFSAVKSIDTPDDFTVVFNLSEPSAPLLSTLASGWGAILPEKLIANGHDFGSSPVGTGPYIFDEWIRDSRLSYRKNPDYWMTGYPLSEELTMHIITERSVQVQGLLSGDLDILYGVTAEDIEVLESSPDVRIFRDLTALVMVIALNTSRPLLQDIRVRQAINHAIDKQTALDIAYGGGEPVGTFMDFNDPYYEDFTELYPFDPTKAKALLTEANIPSDAVLELTLPQNFEPHVRAGELYQEMLENVGLNVKIRMVDWSTWISDVYRAANYDMTVIGHTGKLDPDGRLSGYGTANTYVRWENKEAADLIDKAKATVGFDERRELYSRALEIMATEVPFAFIGSSFRYIVTRSDISGFRMDQKLDTFDFRYTEKK